jgi:hypothetical protein
MPTKGIGTGKASTAAPIVAIFERASADKLLLARMQALMALAIMLSSKCLAAYTADERTLVSMGTEM